MINILRHSIIQYWVQSYVCIWCANNVVLLFFLKFCVALYHLLTGLDCIWSEFTWDQNMNEVRYHYFVLVVISHPRPTFNGGLVNPLLKFGHGWLITSLCVVWMQLLIHVLITALVCANFVSKKCSCITRTLFPMSQQHTCVGAATWCYLLLA